MQHHFSVPPAQPEQEAFFRQLRQLARRKLLPPQPSFLLQDALESAVTDGLLIYWRKLQAAELQVANPQAFAFEIIKRTFWNYRRRVRSAQLPPEDQQRLQQLWASRPRYHSGAELFAALHEPHLRYWYQSLSPRDQLLLDLRCQGFLDKEIATQLDYSYGWVRNRFSFLLGSARALVQRA